MKKILLFTLLCLTITIAQTQIRQIENKHKELIKVYPNPVKEYVVFKFEQPFTGNIEIFNRHGVLKRSINFYQETEKQINVSDFIPDQYLYNITVDQQSITTGIIIKR